MAYRTVNLRPETYERLRMLKSGGATMSDVVEQLLDEVVPDAMLMKALKVHERRVAAVRRRGGLTLEELRRRVDQRQRRATR